jgi:hypothetical protein
MWIAVALLVFAASYLALLDLVLRVRRRPLGLAAPIALALLVCYEALLLDLLSLGRWVTRPGLLLGHLLPLGVLLGMRSGRGGRSGAGRVGLLPGRMLRRARRPGWTLGLVAPLFLVLLVTAVRYAPTNWDSMTYHLARLVYWIQNRSVDGYPTGIPRQVDLAPGGEYLLLLLQLVAGSDRLANLVQLLSWVILAAAAPPLARLAGAPRRLAPWAAVLVAALPMGVLQATSTQNDLVAAALALAILSAAIPFLHREPRARNGDLVLLAAALAAAVVTKPSAVLAAAPFAAWAGVCAVAAWCRRPGRLKASLPGLAAAVALLAVVAGWEILRRRNASPDDFAQYYFAGAGAWVERLLNATLGAAHHLPFPSTLLAELGARAGGTAPQLAGACPRTWLCLAPIVRTSEDIVGNPFQALLVVGSLALAVSRRRLLPPRSRAFLIALVAAWLALHALLRDNVWFSRIQTPLFALLPLALGAFAGQRQGAARWAGRTLGSLAVLALVWGAVVAFRNESRPPFAGRGILRDEADCHYLHQPALRPLHQQALEAARAGGCRQLGLFIGGDSYDYPLSWRAVRQGIAVRHVLGADPWPCLVFSDRGAPPSRSGHEDWEPVAWSDGKVYLHRPALR